MIDDGSTYAARCDADNAGRFHFPSQEGPYQLMITHPSGFAYLKPVERRGSRRHHVDRMGEGRRDFPCRLEAGRQRASDDQYERR